MTSPREDLVTAVVVVCGIVVLVLVGFFAGIFVNMQEQDRPVDGVATFLEKP